MIQKKPLNMHKHNFMERSIPMAKGAERALAHSAREP
jgi:hypothetical protein